MERKRKNPILILLSFLAVLFIASACGKNFANGMPIGIDCGGGSCGGFGFDDPTQIDDGSYHEGEDPNGGVTLGGGGTSGGSEMDGGATISAPRRFSYVQSAVPMNGGPDF